MHVHVTCMRLGMLSLTVHLIVKVEVVDALSRTSLGIPIANSTKSSLKMMLLTSLRLTIAADYSSIFIMGTVM